MEKIDSWFNENLKQTVTIVDDIRSFFEELHNRGISLVKIIDQGMMQIVKNEERHINQPMVRVSITAFDINKNEIIRWQRISTLDGEWVLQNE